MFLFTKIVVCFCKMDYYGLLDITRNATDLEIKQAFKKIALKFNRSLRQDECVQDIFILVAEAYDVLSDDKRRSVYDQYGEEGLKDGVPTPGEFFKPYVYHGDYMRTYEEFYGTNSPYADILEYYENPLPIYDLPEGKGFKNKQEPLVRPIYCTIEEIYHGGVKKMKILRQELISTESEGLTELREKVLDVPIKPGMIQGTRIVFPEEGDQGPTIIPADVVFVVTDRPHDLFVREGMNLVMNVHVNLLDALVGTTITVTTPDHRTLRVPINDVVNPNYTKIVQNEGMPNINNPSEKGDLIIRFMVDFPTYLPRASKNLIRKALNVAKMVAIPGEAESIALRVLLDKMNRIRYRKNIPDDETCYENLSCLDLNK